MKHAEIKAMMAEVAPVIREYAAAELLPVSARLDALEKRLDELPAARDGKDADPDAVAALVREGISDELAELRSYIEQIPEPPVLPDIPALVSEAVAAIPVPQDGKSVTVEDVRPLIEETVSTAFSALPVPKDGEPGKPGKDGLDAVSFTIDRAGHLVASMSDGTTRDLGEIVGKDGAPGKDGLGFEDFAFDVDFDGKRTFTLKWSNGDREVTRSFTTNAILDQGVYKAGVTYAAGDAVSYGGSMWIAQEDTDEKPDGGKGWRLAVKRGRDGKDGTIPPPPKPTPIKVR